MDMKTIEELKVETDKELKDYISNTLRESKRGFLVSKLNNAEGFKVTLMNYGLNYIVEFFENRGWGIYLEVSCDDFYELNETPDHDYMKICEKVDEINFEHFSSEGASMENYNSNINRITQLFAKYNDKIIRKKVEDNKFIVDFKEVRKKKTRVVIKFSPMINFWEVDYEGMFDDERVQAEFYSVFEEIEDLIYEINETR